MVITKNLVLGVGLFALVGVGFWLLFSDNNNSRAIKAVPARPQAAASISIVAFGDSLTAGYGLPASESYPAQLESVLQAKGYSVTVVNAGVSGETTRGNLERAPFIRAQNPDIVLLGIGGNDALRLLPLSDTRKNIASTIEILQAGDQPPVVILLAMQAPLTSGLGYKQEFDQLYSDLANTYEIPVVPFITSEVFLQAENKLPDGIHYNKTGYGIVVQNYLLPVVEQVLSRFKEG